MSGVGVERGLAGSTAYGLAVRAVGMALGFVVAVYLARMLGAEDLGAYQGVLSIAIILAGMGAANAERPAARRIAAMPDDDPEGLAAEVGLAHLVTGLAIVTIVFILVSVSLVPAVADPAVTTLRLAAFVVPGLAILSLRQWIALPLQGVAVSLGPEQIGLPVAFLGLVGVAARQGELAAPNALVAYAGACWMVWLVASWRSGLLVLLVDGLRALPPSLGPTLRRRFREGRSFVLLAVVGALSIYATVPVVAALLDLESAGRLAIAMQMAGLIAVPLQIVNLAITPRCAKLHRDGDAGGLDDLVRSASALSLLLGLGLAVLLLLSLDTIVGVLGPSFAATKDLVPVLVVGQLINAACGPNSFTLQMIGLDRDAARMESVATLARFVAVAVAALAGSILGVAWAVVASTALRNLLVSITLYRRTGILTLPKLSHRRAFNR